MSSTVLDFIGRPIGNVYHDITDSERDAGVTIVDNRYAPGYVRRYGDNDDVAFQAAIDSASDEHPEIWFDGEATFAAPVIFRANATQNLSIIGTGRTAASIKPAAVDISGADGINTLFINKCDNLHLHLRHFQFRSDVVGGYTGTALYCVQGGGTGDVEALFSAVFEDLWVAFQSTNTGAFQGGFTQLLTYACTYESTNDCWILQGAGNGGQLHFKNDMNRCLGSYIRKVDDAQLLNTVQVVGLNVVAHLRGRVFDLFDASNFIADDITLEVSTDQVAECWLGRFEDCPSVRVTNVMQTAVATTDMGAGCLEAIGSTVLSFSGIKAKADVGLRFQGVGTQVIKGSDSDFSECLTGVQWLSGTIGGRTRLVDVNIDQCEYGYLHSAGTMNLDLDVIGGRAMNAGITGTATNRNIALGFAGDVNFYDTEIGQDDGDADAACYILASGSGAFNVMRPRITGAPPTSIVDAASTQPVNLQYDATSTGATGGAGSGGAGNQYVALTINGTTYKVLHDGTL